MAPKASASQIQQRARIARKDLTLAEAKLWSRLRAHRMQGVHFRRQHVIGPYIADFCAPREKIIIELDGGQHLDQGKYDAERTAFLESKGYHVIRFWNDEVMKNIDAVLLVIDLALREE